MKALRSALFAAVLAISLVAMAGTAWAWDGGDLSDGTGGISWETTPGLF